MVVNISCIHGLLIKRIILEYWRQVELNIYCIVDVDKVVNAFIKSIIIGHWEQVYLTFIVLSPWIKSPVHSHIQNRQ